MEAGHEDDAHARLSADVNRAHGDDLARVRAGAEALVALAVHFTGQAGDATRFVMVKDVCAHWLPPSAAADLIWTIVSVMAQPPPAGSKS